jgi:hypothetical protein
VKTKINITIVLLLAVISIRSQNIGFVSANTISNSFSNNYKEEIFFVESQESYSKSDIDVREKYFFISKNGNLGFFHASMGMHIHMQNFIQNAYVGGYTGLEYLRHVQFPLTMSFHYFFPNNSRVTPFINISGGWAVGLEDSVMNWHPSYTNEIITFHDKGGPHYSTELGFMLPTTEQKAWFIKLGYRYEYNTLIANEVDLIRRKTFHRFSLGFGVYLF